MNFKDEMNLSEIEEKFLNATKDISMTKARIKIIFISSFLFIAALCIFGFITQSYLAVLIISLLYILLTLYEKVAHGNGVIIYKSIIQKLYGYIENQNKKSI
jgi:hypothetical protein